MPPVGRASATDAVPASERVAAPAARRSASLLTTGGLRLRSGGVPEPGQDDHRRRDVAAARQPDDLVGPARHPQPLQAGRSEVRSRFGSRALDEDGSPSTRATPSTRRRRAAP